MNTKDFILKAQEIHNNKYNYSKVDYINSHTKVEIICPEHGSFWQTPNNHLSNHGCPKCARLYKPTTQEFIIKANQIHNNKYDYSKVEYKNAKTPVTIICPMHGEFQQTPDKHINRKLGCPKCANNIRKTTEQFIQEAKLIHGDKYDYSKVEYINTNTKVCIICSVHGEFWLEPSSHLSGKGCPKCSSKLNGLNKRLTTEEFIEKAKQIHGNKYDYSKVNYIKSSEKVCIICPEHGEFWQIAGGHLLGQGCPKCNNKNLSTEELIQKFNIKHNFKYNYDKMKYVNSQTKIIITCPIHGDFEQTPSHHMNGEGCPKCNSSKGELYVENFLQNQNIQYIRQYEVPIDVSINISGKAFVDFYLPEYNLFIEYNGKQHYVPKEYFGGQLQFEKQQKRDEYIRNYCKTNNIKLLEIRYDDNIEKILNKYFNANNILSTSC